MSYDGPTRTKFGRYRIAEEPSPEQLHTYTGRALKLVDHEPPIPVLDQEDLLAQGIHTSQLVQGVEDVDALGSCTCNAGTASLAERTRATGKPTPKLPNGLTIGTSAAADEAFAIVLYHMVTDQTGDPSQEWPPTDCGSTGLYVCEELERLKLIAGHKAAANAQAMLELLQEGTVIMGAPWFNAWMQPDAHGFVDGNGTPGDLQSAIDSGVAGGHETCITAIEQLSPNVVLRVRNSWSSSWGDAGSYRIHLSTLEMLSQDADFKQFRVA